MIRPRGPMKHTSELSQVPQKASLGLNKERPSYRRSLQLSKHPAIQNMKFLKKILLFLWVIFALLVRIRIPNTDLDLLT